MSTDVTLPAAPAAPRRTYPPAISNLLAMWWLTLGFWALLLAILWPEMPLPGGIGNVKTGLLAIIFVALVVLGTVVGYGLANARPQMLRMMKLTLLASMGVGLVVVAMFFISKMRTPDAPSTPAGPLASAPVSHPPLTFLGPSPAVAGAFLGLAGLMPFLFALFALSFTTGDEVNHYFYPPPEEERTTVTRPLVVSRAAALSEEASVEAEAASAEAVDAAEEAAQAEADIAAAEAAAATESATATHDHDAPLAVDSELDLFADEGKDKK